MKRDIEFSSTSSRKPTRREVLASGGKAAAGIAAAGLAVPRVHAAEDNTIRLALIGCGGRGSGAAGNALSVPDGGPVKLFAMADLFENRLLSSHKALSKQFGSKVDVPPERRLLGFDAYKRAIDLLRPGDVAMLTGYAGWRPLQMEYAVAKGINVFMEKSFATDPPAVRRLIAAGEEAQKRNLKVAAGLMCRHSPARHELIRRIRDGQLGELQLIRGYRMQPVGPMGAKPESVKELHWQIRNFTRFFWVSGGLYAEMDIHQIDEICWLKDALPVTAHGIGGRAPNNTDPAQNLDSHHVEYTFADGTKAIFDARYRHSCFDEFATYVHGTKRAAQFSGHIHAPTVHTYRDQRVAKDNIDWRAEKDPHTPWQAEWNALIAAIRHDRPHNETRRAALSNLADIMGRAAIHSGKIVTWDEAYQSDFQWCPGLDQLGEDTPPPVQADATGRYPSPSPGDWVEL